MFGPISEFIFRIGMQTSRCLQFLDELPDGDKQLDTIFKRNRIYVYIFSGRRTFREWPRTFFQL